MPEKAPKQINNPGTKTCFEIWSSCRAVTPAIHNKWPIRSVPSRTKLYKFHGMINMVTSKSSWFLDIKLELHRNKSFLLGSTYLLTLQRHYLWEEVIHVSPSKFHREISANNTLLSSYRPVWNFKLSLGNIALHFCLAWCYKAPFEF